MAKRKAEADLGEPEVTHDRLTGFLQLLKEQDAERQTDVGAQREDIKAFLEDTKLNKKALSICRALFKQPHDKAMDILASLDLILPMVQSHIEGQGTADMFDKKAA